MLLVAGILGIIVALSIVVWWYYWRNLSWKIKLITARLNKIIRAKKRDRQVVQQVLKKIYVIIYRSMALDNSVLVYQSVDLLKLAFGYGVLRPRESNYVMKICTVALHDKKPDTVSFVLDVFRPLVRQVPLPEIITIIDQLTLIGAMALKQRYNFLAAKVVECIFFIMEQTDVTVDQEILAASIKGLKTMGVLGLRRRDVALFREVNMRLAGWLTANPQPHAIAEEITKMIGAWLYRIMRINDLTLFSIMTELVRSLLATKVLREDALTLLFDEWGDVAATACLNPNSQLASLILDFMFTVVASLNLTKQWMQVIRIAGRVAKLAVYRHGLIPSFMMFCPLLETGRKLLWTELNFVEYIDELHQQQLFRVVRECLIILNYAARKNLLGSTGELIVDLFIHWVNCPECNGNPKSIKKYCQFLLLFWLKTKKQSKRYMPRNMEFIQPILFSEGEKQRLGL